ncbi:hypothetical protein EC968_004543 [Mortierella alpina]|nr:hypothetical protein EC968_004543 [Mortierella alpina]
MSCPAGYTIDKTPRVAPFAAATETFEPGHVIKHWYCDLVWTKNHLPASKLEPLRCLGDPLADDALAALEIKRGEDALEALLAYTAQPSNKQRSSAPQQLLTQMMTVPEWVDWDRLKRGQQVYCGTAMPKFMKVLNSTGYLFGKKTTQRILETAQFVFDVAYSLDNLQPGSGIAWKSIIQVRFLHAGVRARLSKISRAHPKYYNIEEDGVPINQEDQLATLFSLSAAMWRVLGQKMDVHMTIQEREDYLHLWRYVGYMLGVDDILGVTETPELADACLESIVLHLGNPSSESGQLISTWSRNFDPQPKLLFNITKALGLLDSHKLSMALSEHLLGSEVWRVHGLPPATWPYRVIRELILRYMVFDLWLTRKSPRWFRLRCFLIRELQVAITAYDLGNARTHFELKEEPQVRGYGPDIDKKAGEDGAPDGRWWLLVLAAALVALCVAFALGQQGWLLRK